MHLVYQNAWVTIVAAAGQDATFGLPGVDIRPRLPQPSAKIGDKLLVSTLPELKVVLKFSKWITRGWTYQEGVLAKRRLFFTEHQVYFACESYSFRESIENNLRIPHEAQGAYDSKLQNIRGSRRDSESVMGSIAQYSIRELTVQSDIFNAILGIFGVYESHKYPVHQVWGLPVAKSAKLRRVPSISPPEPSASGYSSNFAPATGKWFSDDEPKKWIQRILCALCWSSEEPCTRRDGYPSWSWIGWIGKIRGGIEIIQPADNVEVFLEVNGQKVNWNQLEERLQRKLNIGQTLYIKGSTILCSFCDLPTESPGEKGPNLNAWFWHSSNNKVYMKFHLVKRADPGLEFYNRLCSQQFTGVILGHGLGREEFDPNVKDCPVVLVVDRIGTKYERIGFFRLDAYYPDSSNQNTYGNSDQNVHRNSNQNVRRNAYQNTRNARQNPYQSYSYMSPEQVKRRAYSETVISEGGFKEISIV
jgi:hypothetical protein